MKKKLVLKNWVVNVLTLICGVLGGSIITLCYIGLFSLPITLLFILNIYILLKYGA